MKSDAIWIGVSIIIVAGVVPLVLYASSFDLVFLFAAAVLAFIATVRVMGPSMLSPVQIVAGGFIVVAGAGWLLYPSVVTAPQGGGIRLFPSEDIMLAGYQTLLYAAVAVCGGALIATLFMRRPDRPGLKLQPIQTSPKVRGFLVFISVCATVILLATRGIDELMERATYLPEESGGGLSALIALATTITAVASGYLLMTQRGLSRFIVFANLLVYFFVMFSTGSRRFAAIPLLIAIGIFAAKQGWLSRIFLVASGIVSLALVPLPLYFRSLGSHGLIPYLAAMPGFSESEIGLPTMLRTILISLPIIGATVRLSPFPLDDLWISLTPVDGPASGWYAVAGSHRLNPYTPTAALGELANAGIGYLIAYCVATGILLGILDRHVRRLILLGHQMIAFGIIGLSGLFLVYSIQYNLRSSTRMLYYLIALDVAMLLFLKVQGDRAAKKESELSRPEELKVRPTLRRPEASR